MKVTVVSGKDGARRDEIELSAQATLVELRAAYRPKVDVNRKTFKIATGASDEKGRPKLATLDTKRSLAEQGVKEGTELVYKDLGPQIGYRTVFVVEYAGPIAFILLYAARPSFIYGSTVKAEFCYAQKLFITLFAAHFLKRELETFFVHKFSRPTMPFRNIFKNCTYYWTFAAFIGYILCHPDYTAPSVLASNVGAAVMVVSELLNFAVHKQLSSMRKGDGDEARNTPAGPLFSLVSCPNYLFEVLSWVGFSTGTSMFSAWFFTFAGLLQMTEWALKKHAGYCKADPANKKKKSIIPFVI